MADDNVRRAHASFRRVAFDHHAKGNDFMQNLGLAHLWRDMRPVWNLWGMTCSGMGAWVNLKASVICPASYCPTA